MSVYAGIDVHRKRSQVAVTGAKGKVIANRNVPNGVGPILKVIGGLPLGTPAAFEAVFGTSWLVELLEDYGFTRTWCTRRGASPLVPESVAAPSWPQAGLRQGTRAHRNNPAGRRR